MLRNIPVVSYKKYYLCKFITIIGLNLILAMTSYACMKDNECPKCKHWSNEYTSYNFQSQQECENYAQKHHHSKTACNLHKRHCTMPNSKTDHYGCSCGQVNFFKN